jgi:DNA-binding LacI/PurR family transcriptional regulator
MSKPVRLEDVAHKAGVSITTVSHVINKTRYVKRETRELVLQTLEDLHYDIGRPRRRRSDSTLIGVIVADITEDYYISVVKAIETYATEQSYSILLCDSEDDPEKEKRNIRSILDKEAGGLIIAPVNSEKSPRELREAQIPMVFVDRKLTRHDTVFVGIDNFGSGYFGTEYLAGKGCRTICFIGYPETVYTVHQRAVGYRDYLSEHMPEAVPQVLKLNYRQEDSTKLIREFVERVRPDGVLCATSDVCYQLIGSLVELGIGVPDQIKIVTYDDNKWLDYLTYPISVITQPTSEIGFTAIDALVRLMNGPGDRRKIATEVLLKTGFIDRL